MTANQTVYGHEVVQAMELVRRFAQQCHPKTDAALLAGSRARGTARPNSDYDIVLLFSSLPAGAWREVVTFEGQTLEVFGHDLGTFSYFCRELDRPSGKPVLPALVAEGISVLPSSLTLEHARTIAEEIIAIGPPPLTEAGIRHRRYVITDLAMAIHSGAHRHELLATGATLYIELADFALRANGHWGATGKALPRALAAVSPTLAGQFEDAFVALNTITDIRPANTLVDDVLRPFGGRLREGYHQAAPSDWTDDAAQHRR